MTASFHFKVLKSSWGISILLVAEDSQEGSENCIKISDKISLGHSLPFRIVGTEWGYLVCAVQAMAEDIETKLPDDRRTFINILDIQFAETDYQEEGLYCAMAGWLSERYDVKMPNVKISYDKISSRYKFDFEGSPA